MSLGLIAGLRGRQPVKPPADRFAINFLHSYLRAPLGDPQYPIDVSGGITEWQMLGNGPDPSLTVNGGQPVGDCTFAGRQHLRMAKAAAAGKIETWETADELVSEYLAYDHGVDRGANIAEVLMYWFLSGKIRAFAPVDHSDPQACDTVMAVFHGLYVGVDLTGSANTQFASGEPWTLGDGEQPDPNEGHCIVKVQADGNRFDTWVTWGALQRSTREWTAACVREAWAVVTTEDEAGMLHMPDLLADILAASKKATAARERDDDPDRNTGAAAFGLGWQMAQLYGPLPQHRPASPTDHLPAIAEYDTPARMDLAYDLVQSLLRRARLHELVDSDEVDSCRTTDPDRRRNALRRLHFRILDTLDCADVRQAASYQLGRALSDVCWFPDTGHKLAGKSRVDVLFEQFSRNRLANLQGWLGQMSSLAPQRAPIVSRSLQNWSDWLDANAKALSRHWGDHEQAVVAALRTQNDAWHQWLSTEDADLGQPPMGAWIHAGESILRGTRATAGRMLRWFWPVALVLLAATGGLLYLALRDAHGTARVWTALLTVAGGISISGAGLRSGAAKLAGGLEQTAYQAAALDAQAWTVTWLPSMRQGPVTRYRLHKQGVAPPSRPRRFDRPKAAGIPPANPDRESVVHGAGL